MLNYGVCTTTLLQVYCKNSSIFGVQSSPSRESLLELSIVFGHFIRLIAFIAVISHVWIGLIVAPWHHLTAHVLPAVKCATDKHPSSHTNRCNCGHRTRCSRSSLSSDLPHRSSKAPSVPHDEEGCAICQVLAQQVVYPDISGPMPARMHQKFAPAVSAIPPVPGALIDPTSRGPPA
jgi:hypothetical protein